MSDLQTREQMLIDATKKRVEAMTPVEREEMWRKQRESFVRAMTTHCEHGELDFEQCAKCRQVALQSEER